MYLACARCTRLYTTTTEHACMDILTLLQERIPPGVPLEIPPKCFVEMGGEFLCFDPEARVLVARFPVEARWQNPTGAMQGGLIVAAIDNTIGPLSYLVAPPSVTTQLNATFIRPVTPDEPYIQVTGEVYEITRRQLHMRAEVHNQAGKLLATATASSVIQKKQ
ncbi:MAG: PaaI family thioesterase [Caldilineae bacterium]|nr:MAG: PaaI family thioesterase [Caldilineae bacterium]